MAHVPRQIELFKNPDQYNIGEMYLLPKKLDEEVARYHLQGVGAGLAILSPAQADYIGVDIDGPYKPESYRY
jgi:adenosylhomocysteinase